MIVALCFDAAILSAGQAAERFRHGAVVSVSSDASDVGAAILRRGGNAVDAAVATACALAVTHPAAGNLGGGGFLLAVADRDAPIAFDFRERAPASATPEMFVNPADRTPHRRVGVPGTLRGLALAHTRLGKLPWRDLVQPAVDLARDGFILDKAHADSLNEVLRKSDPRVFTEFHRVLGKADGGAWQAGDRLAQPDLARTLAMIAEDGADAFYLGPIAELIAEEMQRGRGLVTRADLAAYLPRMRKPLQGTYRGYEVIGMPPPSSGGTTLIEALNILETFKLEPPRWSPRNVHLTIEAARRAYRDRARYLGDPDFVDIPGKLLDKNYARELARRIDPERSTPSAELAGDIPLAAESPQTTHFSVIDQDRLAVSLTYTLENSYGSRVVVAGAGFILNDEMNDFAWFPGITDQAGRIGTPPNQIVPGKRMLSSMCPVILRRDGRPVLITGSPGGRTIINTVLGVVLNVVDFEMDVQAAVDAGRMHHAWFPDIVRLEASLAAAEPLLRAQLEELGHNVEVAAGQGDAHSIWIDPATGEFEAAADKRMSGKAAGF